MLTNDWCNISPFEPFLREFNKISCSNAKFVFFQLQVIFLLFQIIIAILTHQLNAISSLFTHILILTRMQIFNSFIVDIIHQIEDKTKRKPTKTTRCKTNNQFKLLFIVVYVYPYSIGS